MFTICTFAQAGGEVVHEQVTLVIPSTGGKLPPKEAELRLRVVDDHGHQFTTTVKLNGAELERWVVDEEQQRELLIDHYVSMFQRLDEDVVRGKNTSTNAKIDVAKAQHYISLADIAAVVQHRREGASAERQPDQNAQQTAPLKDKCKDKLPRLIYRVEPEYTKEAKKAKVQGTVVLEIVIDTDGSVQVKRVIKSLGLGLDESAVASVADSKFAPLPEGCTRTLNFEVNFNLR
jgi:TonB family protein